MLGEIIVFAMLKDEDASFVEIVAIQNEVWNLREVSPVRMADRQR